ncbi:MAG: hypothetical protein ABI306_10215, partial [Caulobacteraceae bacterium]
STAALAAPTHLTDSQYLTAVRCQALMSSAALGKIDTGALDSLIKAERSGRVSATADRADEVRADAAREARHAGVQEKAQLIAERGGVCQTWNEGGTTTAAAQMAQPTSAN